MECIETHISWLLLVGDMAYTIQSLWRWIFWTSAPPALRLAACQEELRINRRTARTCTWTWWAWRATAAIPGPWRVKPWAAGYHGAEPAVLMRRFDQQALLSRRLRRMRGRRRHGCPGQSRWPGCTPRRRLATWRSWAGRWRRHRPGMLPPHRCVNAAALVFDAAQVAPGQMGDLERLEQWCAVQIALKGVIWANAGAVAMCAECHGDLHLANIAWIDGQPQLFDALEFSPDLRWIDCMAADLAFGVDLQARGRLTWPGLRELAVAGALHGRLRRPWRCWATTVCTRAGAGPCGRLAVDAAASAARRCRFTGGPCCADGMRRSARATLPGAGRGVDPAKRCGAVAGVWLVGLEQSTHSLPLVAQRGAVRLRVDNRAQAFVLAARGQRSDDGIEGSIYTPGFTADP